MFQIQNPFSTDKGWNPVTGIRNPRRRIQNRRLSLNFSYIIKHGATGSTHVGSTWSLSCERPVSLKFNHLLPE